jgi:hypothetical protein
MENTLNISQVVDRYMALTGSTSPAHRFQYLLRAKEIWRDIRNNVLRATTSKWVKVDKSKKPYRATIPKEADMFLSVGAKNNCGDFVVFGVNKNIAPFDDYEKLDDNEQENTPCDCEEKGECICLYEKKVELEEIQGQEYEKTTEITICKDSLSIKKTIPTLTITPIQIITFPVNMLIYDMEGNQETIVYSDAFISDDLIFHQFLFDENFANSKIHYINGIYSTSGVSYWSNTSIKCMFRVTFEKNDVGVSNHSNRGINEINGFLASTPEAYEAWREI